MTQLPVGSGYHLQSPVQSYVIMFKPGYPTAAWKTNYGPTKFEVVATNDTLEHIKSAIMVLSELVFVVVKVVS